MTMQNNSENQPQNTALEDEVYSLKLSRRDIELLFKYLARTDLKGAEVPEMNKVIALFDPKVLSKI